MKRGWLKTGKYGFSLVYFVIFSMLGLFSLFWLVSLTFHSYGADYRIYLNAYVDARAGVNPYEPYFIGTSFLNHPLVLIIVRLLFLQGGLLTSLVWSFVSVIAWLACFMMATSLSKPGSSNPLHESFSAQDIFLLTLFMVFGPFLETISIGQVNTLSLFFILASLVLSEMDRPVLAGVSIGTAILIKTSPALFLIYFLLIRRYRVIIAALVTMLVLTLLSQIPFPIDVITPFFTTVLRLPDAIAGGNYGFALTNFASRILAEVGIVGANNFIRWGQRTVFVILILLLSWFGWRYKLEKKGARIWLFACFQVLAVFFSPLVWYHHYVFLMFPILLLISQPSIYVRGIGLVVLTAFQLERYFGHTVVWFPWPSILGTVLLSISVIVMLIKLVRDQNHPEANASPASLEAA
jgi:alpha-1,2-mannosyltransferase